MTSASVRHTACMSISRKRNFYETLRPTTSCPL